MKNDEQRQINLLELGIGYIKNFGKKFVAYNTKFIGISNSNEYVVNGESTKKANPRSEFCYGYDEAYKELHILDVYETANGKRFAVNEIAISTYAFWEILN